MGDNHEPLEEDDIRDTLEDDLCAIISECQAEEELSRKALDAQMLADHTARAKGEAEVAMLMARDAYEHCAALEATQARLVKCEYQAQERQRREESLVLRAHRRHDGIIAWEPTHTSSSAPKIVLLSFG